MQYIHIIFRREICGTYASAGGVFTYGRYDMLYVCVFTYRFVCDINTGMYYDIHMGIYRDVIGFGYVFLKVVVSGNRVRCLRNFVLLKYFVIDIIMIDIIISISREVLRQALPPRAHRRRRTCKSCNRRLQRARDVCCEICCLLTCCAICAFCF